MSLPTTIRGSLSSLPHDRLGPDQIYWPYEVATTCALSPRNLIRGVVDCENCVNLTVFMHASNAKSKASAPKFSLLARSVSLNSGTDFDVVVYFPWRFEDHVTFSETYGIDWKDELVLQRWKMVVNRWAGVAVICGKNDRPNLVRFVRTTPKQPLQILHQLEVGDGSGTPPGFRYACWSFDRVTLEPLVLLGTTSGNVTVYAPYTKKIHTVLRGHGGRVTSLTTHPRNPRVFASTSRDKTTRLWSLDLPRGMKMQGIEPYFDRLGPMFGGPLTSGEVESTGEGHCFALTTAGDIYGHNATVLDSSFHPDLNLLATCGVDHCVKIWAFEPAPSPTQTTAVLQQLSCPIFSMNRLHHSLVICIHWLTSKLLVSQSLESMNWAGGDPEEGSTHPAKIAVWEWGGYDRYLQTIKDGTKYRLRYENSVSSASFTVHSEIYLRFKPAKISLERNLVVLASPDTTRVFDLSQIAVQSRPEITYYKDYEESPDADINQELIPAVRKKMKTAHAKAIDEYEMFENITMVTHSSGNVAFAAALSRGMLLRVGDNEMMRVWSLRPSVSQSMA